MIMCSKCKKRPAVVFITSMQGNEKKNEGLCMVCAKEMKIPQVSEYMEQLGISDEEIEQISDQMMGLLDGDSFEMGGSGFMPDFLQNMFSANSNSSENSKDDSEEITDDKKSDSKKDKSDKKGGIFGFGNNKKDKKREKDLKFLNNYCTDLTKKAKEGKLVCACR